MRNSSEFDRISLREHVVETEVGAFTDERGRTQRLIFSIVVDVMGRAADDDVDTILSYELLTEAIEAQLAVRRPDLLETLAEGICDRLLAHPRAARVEITIQKPDRVSGRFGVEISRSTTNARAEPSPGVHPQVYCLPPDAWLEDWFPGWVDKLPDGPVALAVEGAPIEGDDIATRHIRFLLAEAAAWAMEGFVPRSDVIASRTEMLDAFSHGRRAIWAPSRMIHAARDPGERVLGNFARAVAWFATEMQAAALTYVNREAPGEIAPGMPVCEWSPQP